MIVAWGVFSRPTHGLWVKWPIVKFLLWRRGLSFGIMLFIFSHWHLILGLGLDFNAIFISFGLLWFFIICGFWFSSHLLNWLPQILHSFTVVQVRKIIKGQLMLVSWGLWSFNRWNIFVVIIRELRLAVLRTLYVYLKNLLWLWWNNYWRKLISNNHLLYDWRRYHFFNDRLRGLRSAVGVNLGHLFDLFFIFVGSRILL